MFELIVVWCLVSDRAICKRPEVAIPIETNSFSKCLRTGAFGIIPSKVDDRGKKWFAHVYCTSKKTANFVIRLYEPPVSVARSPWN